MWPQQNIYPSIYPQQMTYPMQQPQKTAQFYNVESPQELDSIKPSLNVMYFGFNARKKEIYVKQITNDGLISVETYGLSENKKEKTELETVLDKISELENKLINKGAPNVTNIATNGSNGNANANVGQTQQPSFNATI